MNSLEAILKYMDKPIKPSIHKEKVKDRVLKKLNEDLILVKQMTDIDELNYGSPSKRYISKKGEEIGSKNVCWGNAPHNNKRQVRMIIGNTIIEFNGVKLSINVENNLQSVIKGLETLITHAETVSIEDWEVGYNQMLQIRSKKKQLNN
jgi:hypothetical protein